MLKRAIAYTALGLSVTVGGVIIGATVIAPIVSPSTPSKVAVVPAASASASTGATAAPALQTPGAASVLAARAGAMMKSMSASTEVAVVKALRATVAFVASRRMPRLAPQMWLGIGVACTLLVTLLVGLRIRARRPAARKAATSSFLLQTARPASIVVTASNKLSGRVERTPRAVMALAESGAAPAEIARRTGMPLDAVAMCLSMSTMGVRQLQPPTA